MQVGEHLGAKIEAMNSCAGSSPEQATRQMLDALVDNGKTPGFQYVFASAEELRFSHHGGLANPHAKLPVRRDTTFNSYSVTKTFTAAAVLKLVDQGLVDLDRPIAKYADRWPQYQRTK